MKIEVKTVYTVEIQGKTIELTKQDMEQLYYQLANALGKPQVPQYPYPLTPVYPYDKVQYPPKMPEVWCYSAV